MLGGALLIVGGPAGIWRALWVFWAETAAAGITAAVLLRRGMTSLSDEDWLAYAVATLDAESRRRPSEDETPAQRASRVEARRARLAALAAIDRRTPDGAAAFAAARRTEGNVTGAIFGCAFGVFSAVHAGFLLMIGVISTLLASAGAVFTGGGFGDAGGLGDGGLGFGSGDLPSPILSVDLVSLVPLLSVMALVFAAGLLPLRRRAAMPEGEAAIRGAMVRIGILQVVLVFGTIPAILLGSVPLALLLVVAKTAVDAYPLVRKLRAWGQPPV